MEKDREEKRFRESSNNQKARESSKEEESFADLPPPLPEEKEGDKSAEASPKITKDMSIMEIVTQYPETIEPLLKAGLHCIGCYLSPYETLEQGTMGHGMDEEDLDVLLKELNAVVNQQIKAQQKKEAKQNNEEDDTHVQSERS